MDHSYNALKAACKFRAFVYNRCDYNQSTALVEKQRYINFLNGGEDYTSEWYGAIFQNPNTADLYPHALHFSQELHKRTDRQETAIKELTKQAEELVKRLDTIVAMNETNDAVAKELQQENMLMRHRWYRILQKTEMLRRRGIPLGEEELLAQRAQHLREHLLAPCRFTSALSDVEPRIAERAAQVAQYLARREERESFASEVTPALTQEWERTLCDNQVAIERLSKIVVKDTADVRAMLDRA
ncbi:nucleoporin (NUP54/57) [Strigomonas culicis]|uniref:Nucleoporin (NUP54/57) n=1 Tax=Strigomonas culicis TaxID=28005 RepID=S9TKE9_9TRYP|nr:nucleoporin (NUP54/57) [Strigomonas culicis]|eukprot:EPY16823.1 nucleoporin (NUP54/57) [Strigomonas culicis]